MDREARSKPEELTSKKREQEGGRRWAWPEGTPREELSRGRTLQRRGRLGSRETGEGAGRPARAGGSRSLRRRLTAL